MIEQLDNISYDVSDLNSLTFQLAKNECFAFLETHNIDIKTSINEANKPFPDSIHFSSLDKSKNLLYNEVLNKGIEYCYNNPELLRKLTYYSNIKNVNEIELYVERHWIMYQRPGEFVPVHNHSGVLSFVFWINVPFYFKQDDDHSVSKNNKGYFEFIYNDILGNIRTCKLPVDKTWEGKLMIFPAELNHQVYPFYENELRISISGNIRAKNANTI